MVTLIVLLLAAVVVILVIESVLVLLVLLLLEVLLLELYLATIASNVSIDRCASYSGFRSTSIRARISAIDARKSSRRLVR